MRDDSDSIFDLEQYDEEFASADPDMGGEAVDLPDGKYQMVVERAELQRSSKDNPMLVWRMRVTGPRYAGAKHWHRNMLMSRKNIEWLKHDLVVAGLELEKLSDLPNRTDELTDVMLEVQLKTKGDMQNSFINKRVRGAEGAQSASAGTAGDDDDFPF
jgi:hypothetical protein